MPGSNSTINLKHTSLISEISISDEDKENYWQHLQEIISELLYRRGVELNFSGLRQNSYNRILFNISNSVFSEFVDLLKEYLHSTMENILEEKNDCFLCKIIAFWLDFHTALIRINLLFPVIRHIILQEVGKYSSFTFASGLFRSEVLQDDNMRNEIQNSLLEKIMNERKGQLIDRMCVRKVCRMLKQISSEVYTELFEVPFFQKSFDYFRQESVKLLLHNDSAVYVKGASALLRCERVRVSYCLMPDIRKKNMKIAVEYIVENHLKTVLNMDSSGIQNMLKNRRYDEMKVMFTVFSYTKNGVKVLAESLHVHLLNYGLSLLCNECFGLRNFEAFIHCVIQLREEFNYYIEYCFCNDTLLRNVINSVFQKVINSNLELPVSLAMFIHKIIGSHRESGSIIQKDHLLSKAIDLFEDFHDKDIFLFNCIQNLSKRLLHNTWSEDSDEEIVISKFKKVFNSFTSRMEGMIKDLILSSNLERQFRDYLRMNHRKACSPDINVKILTASHWPISSQVPKCKIPFEALELYSDFQEFYGTAMKGRNLILLPQYGTAEVRVNFNIPSKNSKEHCSEVTFSPIASSYENFSVEEDHPQRSTFFNLQTTTYQMCILLLFNTSDSLTFAEIQQKTGIEEVKLVFILNSLTQRGKCSVLSSMPANNMFNDTYTINPLFPPTCDTLNIMEVVEKRNSVEERRYINTVRAIELDNVIIRLLKFRKIMPFHHIVKEAARLLKNKFYPSSLLVLKRLDNLVNKKILREHKAYCNVYCMN